MFVSMIWNTSEMPASHLSRATAIFVVDCWKFVPSWIFGLKIELMACADFVGGTTEQSCHFPDLKCQYQTCSSPRWAVSSRSLVCSENSLSIVGIGPILIKELELIFWSDRCDRRCVYTCISGLQNKLYIYKLKEKCIVFWIFKCKE